MTAANDDGLYWVPGGVLTPQQAVNLASKLLQFATKARE